MTDEIYEPLNLKLWTMPDSYFGEVWPGYYSSGIGQSRDSDSLERSNFTCMLRELGGESDTVVVVRESHWAVGWVEWIAIHQDDEKALRRADEIAGALADYPVVDESHWSELEHNEASESWDKMSEDEREDYAKWEIKKYHWLSHADPKRWATMSYYDLGNDESEFAPISNAIDETLRHS